MPGNRIPLNSQAAIVDKSGVPTVQFLAYLRQIENQDPTYGVADLANIKAVSGQRVYVTDTAKPAWFDADTMIWRYADGTAV